MRLCTLSRSFSSLMMSCTTTESYCQGRFDQFSNSVSHGAALKICSRSPCHLQRHPSLWSNEASLSGLSSKGKLLDLQRWLCAKVYAAFRPALYQACKSTCFLSCWAAPLRQLWCHFSTYFALCLFYYFSVKDAIGDEDASVRVSSRNSRK